MRGSSLSGHRDVRVTPVPRTSREEAREKACAEKFATRQVGGEVESSWANSPPREQFDFVEWVKMAGKMINQSQL